MKTKTIIILLCLVACFKAFAQDIITKKDGKKLKVTIKKVTKNKIKYILFDDPNKVAYTIDKVLITNVEFAFGKKDLDIKDPEKNPYYFADDKVNNILINFSAFSGNTFAVAYEKAINPGQSIMTELKIYGVGSKSGNEESRSGLGIDLHYRLKTRSFFSKKEYRPKHILHGPYFAPVIGFSTGTIAYQYNYSYGYGHGHGYNKTSQELKHTIFHFGIQYGNQWILQRKISIDTSFGFHYFAGTQSSTDDFEPIRLGNMIGNGNKLFSFNIRVGFLTGKKRYIERTSIKK